MQALRPLAPRTARARAGRAAHPARRLPTDLLQLAASYVLALGLPFLGYLLVFRLGQALGHPLDVTPVAFWLVAGALLATAVAVTTEGLLALRSPASPRRAWEGRRSRPRVPLARPFPPAATIIAAYLPNEAATIVATVQAHLALTYPGPLQVVVAYNRPDGPGGAAVLAAEDALRRLAAAEPRLLPLRVAGSTSKAANVNAAVGALRAQPAGAPLFVGIFDADHHPDADACTRAWERLATGAAGGPVAAVQGRCAVRNGATSGLTQLVAVEFEILYGIATPVARAWATSASSAAPTATGAWTRSGRCRWTRPC
jgi:cellulose synthase/poly-beta-1,6-N-acetylglucosamine synthase-like glycosyltransferase